MTTPIRPGFPQGLPAPTPTPRSNAAADAQRAFFQAALQGTPAPVARTEVRPAVTAAPAPVQRAAPAAQPASPDENQGVRLGRYLDIRV